MTDARSLPARVDAVVVGAGLAGAAVARSLALRGLAVLVLETERQPGMHSSGRNAGILRRLIDEPSTADLALVGGAAIADPPADLAGEHPLLAPHGVLLVASGPDAAPGLRALAARGRGRGLVVEDLDAAAALERAPALRGTTPAAAAWCPQDGVIDVAGLLDALLRSARKRGAIVATGLALRGVRVKDGRVTGVETERGRVATDLLVDVAGAHADAVAALANLAPLGLRPCRRHLFVAAPVPAVPHGSPTVWSVDGGAYFRPEGVGVLCSPCDVDLHPPGEVSVIPSMRGDMAERLQEVFPSFGRFVVRRAWAGLRTLTPDDRFVLGPDPRLGGFAWAAGLGGHGVTTAVAVGEATADLVLDGDTPLTDAAAVRPDRLVATG